MQCVKPPTKAIMSNTLTARLTALVAQETLLFAHILSNPRAHELYKQTVAARHTLVRAQGFADPESEEAVEFVCRLGVSFA